MAKLLKSSLLLIMASSLRSFVDTAALPPTEGKLQPESLFMPTVPTTNSSRTNGHHELPRDANVRDLESLKTSLGNTLRMMKVHSTVYTDVNGQKEEHSETHEEVDADGKLLARIGQHVDTAPSISKEHPTTIIQTDVEIPSEGVHKTFVHNLTPENKAVLKDKRRTLPTISEASDFSNNVDKFHSYSKIQYSPLDMAEYVFWTGDEKGVTMAIEEFLQVGLMSREEAITFLQEIKYNLDYLQSHYTQLGLNLQDRFKGKFGNSAKFNSKAKVASERPELSNNFDLSQLRKEATKKAPTEMLSDSAKPDDETQEKRNHGQKHNQDVDYDELLERLRVADFLYTEYSLEEVIYQLAKVMFTQSLTHRNSEAQQALQKFTTFLESEAAQGRISKALEKKVLDVLIASLTDTLSEYPEVLAAARESLATSETYTEKQQLLRKILDLSVEDKAAFRAIVGPYIKDKDPLIEFKTNAAKHVPIGFGKYNTS